MENSVQKKSWKNITVTNRKEKKKELCELE